MAQEPAVQAELEVAGADVRSPMTDGSALSCVLPDTSTLVSPVPAVTDLELRNAR